MKRLSRFAPLLALLAVVAIIALMLRGRAAKSAWQPLPGGGEVRVAAVTYGMEHAAELDRPSWRDRWRDAWRERSLRPLRNREAALTTTSNGTRSTAFWVEARNLPSSTFQSTAAELVLPDGQTIRTAPSSGMSHGSGKAARWVKTVIFPIISARARTLHLKIELNGAWLEFDAPNTAYRTDLPVWKSATLPQVREHEDVALTLLAVKLVPGTDAFSSSDWQPEAVWQITRGGNPAEDLYDVRESFEDASGNVSDDNIALFSEPVWKVSAAVSRTERFPFADNEVRWIGTIDSTLLQTRAPQTHVLLPLLDPDAVARLKLVGVFGPGDYEIENTVVTSARAPSTAEAQLDWDHTRGVHIVRIERPALVILENFLPPTGEAFDAVLFRDEQGGVVLPTERRSMWSSGWVLHVYELPEKPLRIGIGRSEPFTLEFLIDAPARPRCRKALRVGEALHQKFAAFAFRVAQAAVESAHADMMSRWSATDPLAAVARSPRRHFKRSYVVLASLIFCVARSPRCHSERSRGTSNFAFPLTTRYCGKAKLLARPPASLFPSAASEVPPPVRLRSGQDFASLGRNDNEGARQIAESPTASRTRSIVFSATAPARSAPFSSTRWT